MTYYAPPCACVGASGFHEPPCPYYDSAHDPAGLADVEPTFADDDPDAPGYWRGEVGFPWDEYDLRPDVDGPIDEERER